MSANYGTCQTHGCSASGTVQIRFTSEYTPNKPIEAWACDDHEDELWNYFEDHDHFFPIEVVDGDDL